MPKKRSMNKMVSFIMVLFLSIFLVITGRFIYIQASGEVDDVSLRDWASELRETEMVLPAERGKIYDENGNLLAYNRPTYRLYAIIDPEISTNSPTPLHVVDPKGTAEKLAPIIDMDPKEIESIIREGQKNERFQVEFGKKGKNLSKQQMEEIKALNLPGINFMEDSLRYYANGMFASHIIGFTRPDEETDELRGVIGIENKYDKILKGEDGYIKYERDYYNHKLLKSNDILKPPKNGDDIYLTINQKIQILLEDVMSEVDEKYNPERMSAIVMNAKTGEILALSNRPSFNPNRIMELENWYNDAISTPVEPGSTVKMFTWAAAIDSGNYNGNELFPSGKYQVNPQIEPIHDHNEGKGWGRITYDEGFRRSSNVAASRLVWEKMGTETFYEYLQRFHFDQPTGIDLPNETPGQILYNWPSEKLRTAFGQGSTVTPIQQMKAATAIVNEGKMLKPFVVKKIVDSDTGETIKEYKPEVVGEPIKKETAEKMIELLHDVIEGEGGTGKKFRLEHYSVIGKTGTAQIPNEQGGGYMRGRENYIFSFLGMAPKEDPQIMIHVSVKQPKLKPTETGSDPVSYIFRNVMENSLRYMEIEPDQETEKSSVDAITFPNIEGKRVTEAKKILEKEGIKPIIVGNGQKVAGTNKKPDEIIFPNEKVVLVTDKPVMPNIKNWSKADVYQLASLLGVELIESGNGYAVKQSIKEGEPIKKDAILKVTFKAPKTE